MSKRKNKKSQVIIGIISALILLGLILFGANNTSPVEFVADDNLKVYFIDVGQADSILVINENEAMLIDAGNNEDGKDVVSFIQNKGIEKLKYVIRNSSARRPYRRIR